MIEMTTAQRKAAAAVLVSALAVPAEGIHRVFYYDPPGILTVCRGHTGPDIDKNHVYSLAECDAFLTKDMKIAIDKVEACVPGLPPNMLAAWADATFNLGQKIVCDLKNSTAARLLHAHQYLDACRELPRWDKASVMGILTALKGLTKRRAEEMALCLTPEPS